MDRLLVSFEYDSWKIGDYCWSLNLYFLVIKRFNIIWKVPNFDGLTGESSSKMSAH